ncbi:putative aconitate hydratase protein [Phaeoacremonium minimum UCRPA7]|uniref:Large ribosomal subunit protein bL21m n=1 Tax=Phaeoacremonium minimum (strain UCR-PA7) TaxID=1286976 RepID=R8BER5_PHAM7|nr:putative aconitate hydratase protein [Phaeoacremonium minimum UCRPA7]EON97780.1 putative aconitate hydratase protein [Phaeoacremonium minimum UCRPA7]
MSRALLRSVLELRTPVARLPPSFLLPVRARFFNSTSHIVEPTTQTDAGLPQIAQNQKPPAQQTPPETHQPAASTVAAPSSEPSVSSNGPLSDSVRALLPLLAAQYGHYITIHIHGRPYLVTPGDSIRLPYKMPGVLPGDVLRLNRASILGSRDFTLKGAPYVDERLFECRAVVLGVESEPMRIKIKKKQRNRRKKTVRSKHKYTVLRVSELKISTPEEVEA